MTVHLIDRGGQQVPAAGVDLPHRDFDKLLL
jgi:hypothetical protein